MLRNEYKGIVKMTEKTVKVKSSNPIVRLPQSFFSGNSRKVNYGLVMRWDTKKLIITKVEEKIEEVKDAG